MKRKFSKEFLYENVLCEEDDSVAIIKDELYDTSRWSKHYELVFSYEGKLYRTHYSRGATEYQDERPFGYSPKEVECDEVEAYEKTVVDYREVN